MNNKKPHITPPSLAERFLLWFLKGDLAEEVLGDLDEKFYQTLGQHSLSKAKRNYWYQVFKYIRPFALKSQQHRFNNTAMLRHNLLISFRSFKRFKSTFVINLTGLASGLACTLLIYLWASDELGINRFHENGDNLYQVLTHDRWGDEVLTMEYTSRLLAPTLLEEFPEVERAISVNENWAESPGIVSFGDTKLKATDYQIDKDFFQIFSYKLLQGDISNPIPNTKSVLLSDKLAIKLFNDLDVVGKTINWQQEEMSGDYIISGIYEAPSKSSSKQFDLLFDMELLVERHNKYAHWGSNNERTYVLLKEGTDLAAFNVKIEHLLKSKADWAKNTLSLQLFGDRYLYGEFVNAQSVGGRITTVRLFGMVALFILIIACINFMNLTTAKASNRMKEIGVKKAIGARRKALIGQYFSESLMLSYIGLIVALFIAYAFLPQFNEITGKQLSINFSSALILSSLTIATITGLIAGSYPALYLSGLHPIAMLKGKLKQTFGDTWLRKGLVIFQFAISAILITAVMVVSQQIEYIQSKNLGFDRSNLLRFDYVTEDGPGYQAFLEQIRSIPQVENVAGAIADATGEHGGTSDVIWEGKEPDSRTYFEIMAVGYNFIETMQMEMETGRPYDATRDKPGRSQVIFNETGIKAMGLEDPIGKVVNIQGEKSVIIGVVKDFHFQSMYNEINPVFLKLVSNLEYTLVRIPGEATTDVISSLEKVYNEQLEGVPFEFSFVDDDYQAMYKSDMSIAQLSRYFAGIAILISCLGLLGLTAFTAEKRSKEIGIRKALGAGNWRIVYLLSTDFSKMVLMALVIGLPLSYYMADSWIQRFAFGISLEATNFLLVGLITMLIAWMAVGIQTVKAASANPVDSLRNE